MMMNCDTLLMVGSSFPYSEFLPIDKPEDVGRAIDEALSASRPAVVDVYTDPNVPTIPPHITFEQAKNFGTALLHMDPDEEGIIKESVKSVVEGILPHKG
jgi:pyruvate dehydrogenase (quinone)